MIRRLLAAVVLLSAGSAPILAADNYQVKNAAGANMTIKSKDVGGGVQSPQFIPSDPTGAPLGISGAPFFVTLSGATTVSVGNFPATQPISAAALPLPAGAATAANQTTANTSLGSIDGKLPVLSSGRLPVDNGTTPARQNTDNSLAPPTAAAGKITVNTTDLAASTSTQIAPANASRIALSIQCASGAVAVDERGGTLTSAGLGAGTVLIGSGRTDPYFPPVASLTAVTAYTATAQRCVTTEYLR